MKSIVFELCAESIDACRAALPGGAHRIELCSALSEGGITPSHGLIREAVRLSGLPVHVLLRPRGDNFVYTDAEFAVMRDDLIHLKQLGATGVVLGLLTSEGTVDVDRTRILVALAHPLEVTFHRAFDDTARLDQALEEVIATGCNRLLTSGGASNVAEGAVILRDLIQQAAGRIQIAVGGGLRLENAAEVAHITGAIHFHGSVPQGTTHSLPTGSANQWVARKAADIRAMIAILSEA